MDDKEIAEHINNILLDMGTTTTLELGTEGDITETKLQTEALLILCHRCNINLEV